MVLALPVAAALAVGLVLGGRVSRLAQLPLRAHWLFFVAIAIQVVAFPFGSLPWRTGETAAGLLWLVSWGFLAAAAVVNRRIAGVPVVAAGLGMNVAAVVANGGTMPVLPEAMRAAGESYVAQANSTATADPNLALLVDRWAAPDWLPLANVFSVGDIVIAVGAFAIVLAAMGVRLPRLAPRRGVASSSASRVPREARGDAREHLQSDRRHAFHDGAEVSVDDDERSNRRGRGHRGRTRGSRQERDLPEPVAGPEVCELATLPRHAHSALDQDEELVSEPSFARQEVPLPEADLVGDHRELAELRLRAACEERNLLQQLDLCVSPEDHAAILIRQRLSRKPGARFIERLRTLNQIPP
jgi:hypothetical protein